MAGPMPKLALGFVFSWSVDQSAFSAAASRPSSLHCRSVVALCPGQLVLGGIKNDGVFWVANTEFSENLEPLVCPPKSRQREELWGGDSCACFYPTLDIYLTFILHSLV